MTSNLSHACAPFGVVETVVDPIIAHLQAEGVFHVVAGELPEQRVACVEAGRPAPVRLLELIAQRVVREEMG